MPTTSPHPFSICRCCSLCLKHFSPIFPWIAPTQPSEISSSSHPDPHDHLKSSSSGLFQGPFIAPGRASEFICLLFHWSPHPPPTCKFLEGKNCLSYLPLFSVHSRPWINAWVFFKQVHDKPLSRGFSHLYSSWWAFMRIPKECGVIGMSFNELQ